MTPSSRLLEELVELEKKATPGPWGVASDHDDRDHDHIFAQDGDEPIAIFECGEEGPPPNGTKADARLVVALRNAFPAIVSALADRDRVRAKALEEAAQIVATGRAHRNEQAGCEYCAQAIRSLIAPPAEK